jgi:predicted nucleotidyltransferase
MPLTDPRITQAVDLACGWDGLASLWLYGSRARGDHREHSDYDLAVSFTDRAALPLEAVSRIVELRSALQQRLQSEVSLVDLDRAPIPLAATIVSEGRLLLDRAPVQTGWACQRIWSKWEDWMFHRKATRAL